MRFIGSKAQLLDYIKEFVDTHTQGAKSFCDIFSGTASVARYFKQRYEVYSNDLLYFSYCLQKGTIENDNKPAFLKLLEVTDGINPLEYINTLETNEMESLPQDKRLFQNNYSPSGGRMYVTDENALRIDFARNLIEDWYGQDLISENEYYYLVACVIEGIPFVSNISGTYGAYNKIWDKRSSKKFELFNLDVITNSKNNKCYNMDGVALLKEIRGDILYVDPPYNSRQYLPNYHVLETAAKYDFPEIRGVTGLRPYENEKSDFCSKNKVLIAFEELIKSAQFEHIVLSYNTEGIMRVNDIAEIMGKYGIPSTFEIKEIPYRRFKSRSTNFNKTLKELLIYIRKEVQ